VTSPIQINKLVFTGFKLLGTSQGFNSIKLNSKVRLGNLDTSSQLKMGELFTKTMIIYAFRQYTPAHRDAGHKWEVNNPDETSAQEYVVGPGRFSLDNFVFVPKHEYLQVESKSCTVLSRLAEGLTLKHADEISSKLSTSYSGRDCIIGSHAGQELGDRLVGKMDLQTLVVIYTIPVEKIAVRPPLVG